MMDALHSISARPVGGVTSAAPSPGASRERRDPGQGAPAFPGLGDYGRAGGARPGAATESSAASAANGRPQATGSATFAQENGAAGDSLRLSPEAQAQLRELRQRDAEVRAHEKAHMAAGGQYVTGGPSYEYQQGPDGRQYAIGGHVSIDASSIPDDPEAGAAKARQVRRAALAPGEPSAQDRAVAAKASAQEARATREKQQEGDEDGARGSAEGVSGPQTSSGAAGPDGVTAPETTSRPAGAAVRQDATPEDSAPDGAATAWGASGNGGRTEHSGHHHALIRAAETYAAMSQRGVMPTALAPGGTGISLQI